MDRNRNRNRTRKRGAICRLGHISYILYRGQVPRELAFPRTLTTALNLHIVLAGYSRGHQTWTPAFPGDDATYDVAIIHILLAKKGRA